MTTAAGVKRTAEQVLGKDKIVSSDSHIMEPEDLWLKNLTPEPRGQIPEIPAAQFTPAKNLAVMTPRRVWMRWRSMASAPKFCTRPLVCGLFALEDAELQEACFQIANDWMMEYCKAAPGRLLRHSQ